MPYLVAESSGGGSAFPALLLLLPFVLLAFMFLSQRRRAQATSRAQATLQVGSDVCTTSGLFGTLRALDATRGQIEIAPGTVVTFDRRAILPAPETVESERTK